MRTGSAALKNKLSDINTVLISYNSNNIITLSRRCHDEARFEMAVVRGSSELSMKRSSTGARQHDTREGRERKLNSEVYVWHIQSFPITFSICSRVNDICYCDIPSFVGNLCVSLCHCQ